MATIDSLLSDLALVEGQAGNESKHNEAMELVSVLLRKSIVDKDLTAAPGSPAVRAAYIVAAGATGTWATHDNEIAIWSSSGSGMWKYVTPNEGLCVWADDENLFYTWNGAAWVNVPI